MNNHKFTSLLMLYVSYAWFLRVSGSIVPAYLHGTGTTINELLVANALQFVPMILVLVFLRVNSAKTAWRLAITLGLMAVISVINVSSVVNVYLTYIFGGASLALFFVYYNIGHFLYTPKNKTGVSGGVMFAVSPIISIFAPLLAGTLAVTNINYLWAVAAVSFLVAYILTYPVHDFQVKYRVSQSLQAIASTRVPVFIEGIWEAVLFAVIPVLTLNFISGTAEYGQYLSYLAVVGTVAGLVIGRYTDDSGRRSYLLLPISLILSTLTLLLIPAQRSLTLWIVITSLIQMIIPIFWNIMTALVVDQGGDLKVVFPGREIVLAFGRLIGLSLTSILIYYNFTYLALIFLATTILTLPLYLHYQSKTMKRFIYL
jgi:hypothetical protein